MRKTLLSVMMLSALTVATTSLTSCKDYDDDINNLQTQVDGLSTAKTNLESEIASLKTQLETANGKLTTLESTVGANTADITKAKSDIAGLESRLTTAEKTLQSINETLAKKVDQSEFNDSIKSIYGKLESIEDGLGAAIKSNTTKLTNEETARKAADADLQQQARRYQ